jgi:Regulator of chromosome condensation (RCC1) repeat
MPVGEVYAWADCNGVNAVPDTRAANITAICAGGQQQSIALCSDAARNAWLSQLADVKELPALKDVHQVAFGQHHALALQASPNGNEVIAWGVNSSGQLGFSTSASSSQPKAIPTLIGRKAVALSCGNAHSAAVTGTWDCSAIELVLASTLVRPCAHLALPPVPPRSARRLVHLGQRL